MDDLNISAILAFYNLLAAKIGLEDCRTLKEVRNLMPILANYMKFGTPTFVDDPNFGFRNGVDLIALELDEEFHSQLNSDSAESGDDFEAVKIHMAMIYTFRLLQTEAFSAICQQLEDKHQRRFAYMIECLDDRRRWTFAPWPKLLRTDQQHRLPDNEHKDEEGENKENGGERRRMNSLNFAHTPKPSSARMLFFPTGNSPVLKVVSSPRGEEVVRIHALEREVKSLRHIRDIFGRDKDKAEELCQQKEMENRNLLKTVEMLKTRLQHAIPAAEQLPHVEGNLITSQEQISSLARSLKDAQTMGANAQERVYNLQFELDEMQIKREELQEERDKALKKAEDAFKKLDGARAELQRMEKQNVDLKTKNRQMRNQIKEQEDESRKRYDQKVDELALLQIELQELKLGNETKPAVQGNSLFAEVIDGKDKLEGQLSILHSQNATLRRELDRARKMAIENARLLVACNGKALSGPTLDVLLAVKNDLDEWLSEKQGLLERLHAVEELERGHARQWARECPAEYDLFQENLHTMNMHAKQKSEKRMLKLELREHELLSALSYEKQRAESVSQLEQRICFLERELANYESAPCNL